MRYELRDYQRDAASEILKRLGRARRDWREDGDRTSFALSAITGSGKTVIATAVIEAFLYGSTDLGAERDPKVTFLWITDDPALNRQTKARMLDASELLNNWQMREVDEAFPDASLASGHVYFLNTQNFHIAPFISGLIDFNIFGYQLCKILIGSHAIYSKPGLFGFFGQSSDNIIGFITIGSYYRDIKTFY